MPQIEGFLNEFQKSTKESMTPKKEVPKNVQLNFFFMFRGLKFYN